MNQFQGAISKLGPKDQGAQGQSENGGEDATVKTADAIVSGLSGKGLTPEKKKTAGPLVHYLYGTGIGALYGGIAQRKPTAAMGFGSAYGAAAWVGGDEVAVPVLGLGKKPTETPLSKHALELASHLVYGCTLEGVRRLTLKIL
ncbi:MAG TPA: DUF1440 domain-containing protein [Bryobacteraceae bacterium]|jgi:hypothetical protein